LMVRRRENRVAKSTENREFRGIATLSHDRVRTMIRTIRSSRAWRVCAVLFRRLPSSDAFSAIDSTLRFAARGAIAR
jgi:hypothetical protein